MMQKLILATFCNLYNFLIMSESTRFYFIQANARPHNNKKYQLIFKNLNKENYSTELDKSRDDIQVFFPQI